MDQAHEHDAPPIALFLDESGTSMGEPLTLVGAVAFYDTAQAEARVRDAYERALGDSSLWSSAAERSRFSKVGFHFTEDSESVKQVLLQTLGQLEFRAYVAYAASDPEIKVTDRLVAMYGSLLSSVLLRYADQSLSVIFEENSAMDSLYGKMWRTLTSSISLRDATAYRGKKSAPCLAVADYVLGVTRVKLRGGARDFQVKRYTALGRNLAYMIDFDDDRHFGGRRHPIV